MFFFFKQKTAYEMRISDWSSDVCSSDLHDDGGESERLDFLDDLLDLPHDHRRQAFVGLVEQQQLHVASQRACHRQHLLLAARQRHALLLAALGEARKVLEEALDGPAVRLLDPRLLERSEEHKSELQY